MDNTDASTGTGRRNYRIVISRERWRWLPEVFVTAPVVPLSHRGRRVLAQAQDEARRLSHNYIGTEHILLGLIHEGEGVAARALESLGISLEAVRQQVEEIIGLGRQVPDAVIPLTPRAKRVLDLSRREALRLGDRQAGPEHILLGLIAEGEGVAAQVLVRLGADLARMRHLLLTGEAAELPEAISEGHWPDAMRWQPEPWWWYIPPLRRRALERAWDDARTPQWQEPGLLIAHGFVPIEESPGRDT